VAVSVLPACGKDRSNSAVASASAGAISAIAKPATVSNTAPTAKSSPSVAVLGPDGFGALKLGMTASQAMGTGLVSGFSDDPQAECRGILLKDVTSRQPASVDGYLSAKHGVVSIVAPSGVRTPEGIGVGSTTTAVKRAYPAIDLNATMDGGPDVPVPSNEAAFYLIPYDPATSRVTHLSLALKGQDCFS
jgi:hypothetical protein